MPRKKSELPAKKQNVDVVEKIKSSETIISMSLGILVVIISGILVFRYFQTRVKEKLPVQLPSEEELKEEEKEQTEKQKKYRVERGDNLWNISLKLYGSGYNWVDLVQANNLPNPNYIEVGQELSIPEVPRREPSIKKVEVPSPIEGDKYVVVKGDNLWNISVRAYGDGYKWVNIANANKLTNPQLIHPGNILIIPR